MDECIELDKTEIKRDTNCDTNRLKTVSTDKCVETGAQQQTNNKLALTDFRMYTVHVHQTFITYL